MPRIADILARAGSDWKAFDPPLPANEIAEALELIGRPLPEGLVELYHQCNDGEGSLLAYVLIVLMLPKIMRACEVRAGGDASIPEYLTHCAERRRPRRHGGAGCAQRAQCANGHIAGFAAKERPQLELRDSRYCARGAALSADLAAKARPHKSLA